MRKGGFPRHRWIWSPVSCCTYTPSPLLLQLTHLDGYYDWIGLPGVCGTPAWDLGFWLDDYVVVSSVSTWALVRATPRGRSKDGGAAWTPTLSATCHITTLGTSDRCWLLSIYLSLCPYMVPLCSCLYHFWGNSAC